MLPWMWRTPRRNVERWRRGARMVLAEALRRQKRNAPNIGNVAGVGSYGALLGQERARCRPNSQGSPLPATRGGPYMQIRGRSASNTQVTFNGCRSRRRGRRRADRARCGSGRLPRVHRGIEHSPTTRRTLRTDGAGRGPRSRPTLNRSRQAWGGRSRRDLRPRSHEIRNRSFSEGDRRRCPYLDRITDTRG